MNNIFLHMDSFLEKLEQGFAKMTVAVITGFLFLFLAWIVSDFRLETYYHGNGFTRLSINPFEMEGENDLRFRILSPLLGYLLFFRGPAFKYFMLIILALFFGLVYFIIEEKNSDHQKLVELPLFVLSVRFQAFSFSGFSSKLL